MKKLDEIIKNSELSELAKEYTEIILDSSLEDGLLKDIPMVSTIVSLFNFGNSIGENLFRRKLAKFLLELAKVPQEHRAKMIENINQSDKYENSVGETLIEIIDKIDSEKKPTIIGKLFKAFLEDRISYSNFLKLSHIVNRCYIGDLVALQSNVKDGKVYGGYSDELVVLGIYTTDYLGVYEQAKDGSEEQGLRTALTEIGQLLITHGF